MTMPDPWMTSSRNSAPRPSRPACACSRCARAAPAASSDLMAILGQSQPRLSRHLKLLFEAGLLERMPRGRQCLVPGAARRPTSRARSCARLPEDDPLLAADRRAGGAAGGRARPRGLRSFRRQGADWDEMRALDLPGAGDRGGAARRACRARVGRAARYRHRHRPAAGTAGAARRRRARRRCLAATCWRWPAPGWPSPASPHCAVRQADMYRLPLADAVFDAVALQMVLHYAEDPAAALAEAGRVLQARRRAAGRRPRAA